MSRLWLAVGEAAIGRPEKREDVARGRCHVRLLKLPLRLLAEIPPDRDMRSCHEPVRY